MKEFFISILVSLHLMSPTPQSAPVVPQNAPRIELVATSTTTTTEAPKLVEKAQEKSVIKTKPVETKEAKPVAVETPKVEVPIVPVKVEAPKVVVATKATTTEELTYREDVSMMNFDHVNNYGESSVTTEFTVEAYQNSGEHSIPKCYFNGTELGNVGGKFWLTTKGWPIEITCKKSYWSSNRNKLMIYEQKFPLKFVRQYE